MVGILTSPLRVGVIGIGFGQAVHVPAFRRDARCMVSALAATDHDRAARVAERLAVPTAYGDWRALVASDDVDVVSIAVPPALQPDIVMTAAAAGKPVFCEKPLAVDAPAAERMLAAVEAARVAHAVDLELAELPAWAAAKRLLEEGSIGHPRSLSMTWHVRTRTRESGSWKEHVNAGGGAVGGFVTHALYLIEWTLGPVRALTARTDPEGGRTRVDVTLQLVSGCRADLSVSTDAEEPSGCRFEVTGTSGRLVVTNPGPDHVRGHRVAIARGDGPLEAVPSQDVPEGNEDARVAATAPLVSRFIDAIHDPQRVRPDLSDGLRVQRLLDAIADSGRTGTLITT